eukprot:g76759.t1
MGVKLSLLSMAELGSCAPNSNTGYLSVCVGAGFRNCPLQGPPFLSSLSAKTKPKHNKQANQKQKAYLDQGYDCADVVEGRQNAAPSDSPSQRVFWVPGAALPLLVLKLRIHEKCQICGELFFACDPQQGSTCTQGHFVCGRDCLKEKRTDGADVPCPVPACPGMLNAQDVALAASFNMQQKQAAEQEQKDRAEVEAEAGRVAAKLAMDRKQEASSTVHAAERPNDFADPPESQARKEWEEYKLSEGAERRLQAHRQLLGEAQARVRDAKRDSQKKAEEYQKQKAGYEKLGLPAPPPHKRRCPNRYRRTYTKLARQWRSFSI